MNGAEGCAMSAFNLNTGLCHKLIFISCIFSCSPAIFLLPSHLFFHSCSKLPHRPLEDPIDCINVDSTSGRCETWIESQSENLCVKPVNCSILGTRHSKRRQDEPVRAVLSICILALSVHVGRGCGSDNFNSIV
jgi:hypothetical protein